MKNLLCKFFITSQSRDKILQSKILFYGTQGPKDTMFFVYVLLSHADKKLYIGFSENVQERVKIHNEGKVLSTNNRRPFQLIYYEAYLSKLDAEGREKFLKSGSGHRFLKKQLANFLTNLKW